MILACEELFWLNIDIASRGFAGNVCSQIYVHRKFQIKRQPAVELVRILYYFQNYYRGLVNIKLKNRLIAIVEVKVVSV